MSAELTNAELVKLLRDRSGSHINGLYDDEAADRIEQLEAALTLAPDDEVGFPNDRGVAVIHADRYWQLREAEAALAKAQEDARRYRYVEVTVSRVQWAGDGFEWKFFTECTRHDQTLNAAIDAALRETADKEGSRA